MQKVIKHEEGFAAVLVGVLLSAVIVVGAAGYYFVSRSNQNTSLQNRNNNSQELQGDKNTREEPAQDTGPDENQPARDEPAQTHPQKPQPTEFNAQIFYDQVQVGTSYEEAQKLAGGKIGDCAQTAVYPPSGNVSCTWSDTTLRVTLNFTDDKVVSKQKAAL